MDIGQGHQIWSNSGLIGLFESCIGEWARNELSGRRIGFGRRLMGMQGSAIVSRRPILISGGC
jgi:hypothetical protein